MCDCRYSLSVTLSFSAAHFLRRYRGKCEALHGHNYQVTVVVGADSLDDSGMLIDFAELKSHLRQALERFDHTCLNDLPEFAQESPTAEALARVLAGSLAPRLPGRLRLCSVTVCESPDCCAAYRPDAG